MSSSQMKIETNGREIRKLLPCFSLVIDIGLSQIEVIIVNFYIG